MTIEHSTTPCTCCGGHREIVTVGGINLCLSCCMCLQEIGLSDQEQAKERHWASVVAWRLLARW